ncbi:very short patch repair endonuclease [Actinomadura harenae]|uniref:DNA mismatch endonuclease Vsr n=1 Tax=Actinomadura harenae TaxID=2483351 RepID=A0A3M2M671_9ACTN|nr:very short patch repair endonuclease [Actinomadura harenae]RMI42598.1 DNA mismatch endonuclease Vsr [Actinomadura harenae]
MSAASSDERREAAWAAGKVPRPSSEGRSRNMKANRRSDTKPEIALRRALHARGYRYRKDFRMDLSSGVRVRPDIVFTARKVAVFVDGCFWHVCPEHGREPTSNEWYWTPKLRRNVERDRVADVALRAAGWRVVRLWEHVSLSEAVDAVTDAVGPASTRSEREITGGEQLSDGPGGAGVE